MKATLAFLGQIARHWRQTGAIVPSGPSLAKQMARAIGLLKPQDVIVELGPGTGVFTRELAKRYPNHRIIAVEFNPVFVRRLQTELPEATVIQGCASRLPYLLREAGIDPHQVGAVVSGLPLLSLGRDLSHRVLIAIGDTLRPGARYVQFTYNRRAWRKFDLSAFEPDRTKRVWLNMPPAVVMPFRRAG